MFDYGYGMIVDPAGTHVYLHDDPLNALLSIDLATGNRSIPEDFATCLR